MNKYSKIFLDELKVGNFCNVQIPLSDNLVIEKASLFAGMRHGHYVFYDGEGVTGFYGFTMECMEEKNIEINCDYDEKFYEIVGNIIMIKLKSFPSSIFRTIDMIEEFSKEKSENDGKLETSQRRL